MERLRRFLKDEEGVTSLEYALIAAGICGAIIAVMGTLSTNLQAIFTTISTDLASGL